MSKEMLNRICQTLPGAELTDPWGDEHDAWKVGGKMFACVGSKNVGVSLKTHSIEDAALLIEMGRAIKAPYFHRSWIHVPWELCEEEELRDRVYLSYRIVRGGLTKKAQAALPPFDPPA